MASIAEFILSRDFAFQEIGFHFSKPSDLFGVLIANKTLYQVWKQRYAKLLADWKLENSIYAPSYVPHEIYATTEFDKRIHTNNHIEFGNQVIGILDGSASIWSVYKVITYFPTKPNLEVGQKIAYKGCRCTIIEIVELPAIAEFWIYSKTTAGYQSKNDAKDQCKAVYEYLSQ